MIWKNWFRIAKTKKEYGRNMITNGILYLFLGFAGYVDWIINNRGTFEELFFKYPLNIFIWIFGLFSVVVGILLKLGVTGFIDWSKNNLFNYVARFMSIIILIYVTNSFLLLSKFESIYDIPIAVLIILSAFFIFLFSEYLREETHRNNRT